MDENRSWTLIISSFDARRWRAARSDRLQWERVDRRVVQIAGTSSAQSTTAPPWIHQS